MIQQRVRTLCDLYGSSASQYAILVTNLTKVPKGSVGIIEDAFWDAECRDTIYTIRFSGGVYVNVRSSTFLPTYDNEEVSA